MEAHYKELWSIVVKDEKLGEMFATYDSCGFPPIDRNRTVLCGSEDLAQKILERKEYFPAQEEAKVVPVVVRIQDRDMYDAEVRQIEYELFDRRRDFRHILEMHLEVLRRNLEKYTSDVAELKTHLDNLTKEIAELNQRPPIILNPAK